MLIPLTEAVDSYDVSRATLNRRIQDGTLTKHSKPGSRTVLLDTDQLDRHYSPKTSTSKNDTTPVMSVPEHQRHEMALPHGMAQRLVPSPAQLYGAMRDALNAPVLPRLWGRGR